MRPERIAPTPVPLPPARLTTVHWSWRGHDIRLLRAGQPHSAIKVLLVHGFGASAEHWRFTMPALADQADVWAIDLLGFGASSKPTSRLADEPERPGSVRYGVDLWASLVVDAVQELVLAAQADAAERHRRQASDSTTSSPNAGHPTAGEESSPDENVSADGKRITGQDPREGATEPPEGQALQLHLVGNSIGALVNLTAAFRLQQLGLPPRQVVLIDCAQRALDDKRVAQLPPLQRLSRPLVKALVRRRCLIRPLFQLLARPLFIRQVLTQAYPSGGNVDGALVELLHRPSTEPGASESFRGFVNLFNDRLAPELLAWLSQQQSMVPVRMIWGEDDPWEDPAEARRWAEEFACVQDLRVLAGLGHCPHDEGPDQVNPILREWILGNDNPQVSLQPS